jgi:hypothetical protein
MKPAYLTADKVIIFVHIQKPQRMNWTRIVIVLTITSAFNS